MLIMTVSNKTTFKTINAASLTGTCVVSGVDVLAVVQIAAQSRSRWPALPHSLPRDSPPLQSLSGWPRYCHLVAK